MKISIQKFGSKLSVLGVAASVTLLSLPGSFVQAQQPSQRPDQKQPLPLAPSAVLLTAQEQAQKDEALGKPAGSGFKFVAPATVPAANGLVIEQATDGALPLSLDDAISLGLERNVRLRYDRANQRAVRGFTLSVINVLVPNLTLDAQSSAQEIDLVAQGFKPATFAKFASSGLFPPGFTVPLIVKVNTTQANLSMNQVLFNLTDFELFRGTKNETNTVDLQLLSDRGEVVLDVGQQYLMILADQANVANAKAQEISSKTSFDQAKAKRDAGVGVNLDVLRAQVDYQQREQDEVAAENRLAKDTVQLNRLMGMPAGQKLQLTDTAPFQELAEMSLAEAKATAYEHRKDLLNVEENIKLTTHVSRAVRYQRLPTLAFNGQYGIIGITNGSYHGVFNAEGSLRFPIFNEAAQRGQQEVADAQLMALHQREADLRVTIDAQIRASMLDVTTNAELVKVAQSNVTLAQQILGDAQERFKAGVDDNLPVVDAQASVTSAQAQYVQSLYQYNVAKLQLARNTGVVETRYRTYLGQ